MVGAAQNPAGVVAGGGGSRSRGGRRSSIEYKSDVIHLKQGLEVIKNLNAVSWNWKDGSKESNVGFIAEDVAKVMPDLVFHKNGNVEGVNYDLIVVPLVNAIKTQQGQIEQLTIELEQLKYDTVQGGVCQP